MDTTLLAVGGVLFVAYAAQTISGFGATVIALALGAQLLPIPALLLLVVPLTFLQTGYIAVRHRTGIDWRFLGLRILPLMSLGVIGGILITPYLEGGWLRTGFAALVLLLSGRELWLLLGPRRGLGRPLPRPVAAAMIGAAGVIHGVYATGGPLLVYAVTRSGMAKHAFRSTITVVWIPLNVLLMISYVQQGAFDREVLEAIAWVSPSVPLGIVAGELLHHRVDQRRFNIITFALLCAAAISLLVR
ncbi:MAG TPA: sulfite exporter TauE/SafE family protein [Kofleriaceae bacterium]|nr:sulfite exporter TauE/SafE family protein [Kofleriaceae bacterium]